MDKDRSCGPVLVALSAEDMRARIGKALVGVGLHVVEEAPTDRHAPCLVLTDAPEDLDGVCGLVASHGSTHRVSPPVMLVASGPRTFTRAQALTQGADDLALWEDGEAELVAKAAALVRRREGDVGSHPLTYLPGGGLLHAHIAERLEGGDAMAVVAFDLEGFKAFNDCYGFARGDELLTTVAEILINVALSDEIVYHIGGDDFFAITTPERADVFAGQVIEQFDDRVAAFYDPADRRQGYISGRDRRTDREVRVPLMGIKAACATSDPVGIAHVGQLSQILAELKAYAKQQPGSCYVRDRRRAYETPERPQHARNDNTHIDE